MHPSAVVKSNENVARSIRYDSRITFPIALDAPIKRIFSFENAAHAVAFEQFQAFHAHMLDTVLPETYGPMN